MRGYHGGGKEDQTAPMEAGRWGEGLPPVAADDRAGTRNQNATAAGTHCGATDSGGLSAPAAGLEPATRRLTAACSTD